MEDLQWKKESTKRLKYLMLFLIRFAEIITSSIIPSVIGIIILFITPEMRVIQTMSLISLMLFLAFNLIFWLKYIRHRPKRVEFYIMNGLVYALYVVISLVVYKIANRTEDALLYVILFSNLRGFELFGSSTVHSLMNSHILLVFSMIICEIIGHSIYEKKAKIMAENGAEKPEIKEKKVIPQKDNEVVRFLTVDEVNQEYEREIIEAAELIKEATSNVSDKNWDEGMVQGEGGKVIEKTPIDPDNDIEDKDYVSEVYARNEMSITLNYDVDSLWNKDIYENKDIITDYDEEIYTPQLFDDDDSELWNSDMYRGRGEAPLTEEPLDEEEILDDDEGDELWNSDMYRGRGEAPLTEEPLDEEEILDGEDDELWNSDMYRGRGEAPLTEEPLVEEEILDGEGDELWNLDMYRGRGEAPLTEEPMKEDELIIDDDKPNEFNININYDEPEEYLNNGLLDYDSDSLWNEFKQGK